MSVKITEDMYDTFTNNGYTQDDIQNTVNHYRDQGMPDSAIFTNLNKRYRDLANIKDVSTPQIGDQPNYDDILNNPALNPQQQAEQIKQKGEAYRSNLDQQLPADIAKNTLQGYVNNAGDFGKGLLQGVSSLGVGLGKNVINPLRTNLGKQPLTDEQLNNLYGVLAQKPTSLSGQVGKGIGEVLPYLTLPEATPFKGAGVASTLGNLGVTGAYQGALANTLSSLANKGISPDTLRDMATGAGRGALLNVGLGSALRYGLPKVFPKLSNEYQTRKQQVMQRRNTPLSERYISPEELQKYINADEPKPSNFGVNAIDTQANQQIAKQMEQNIQAEKELYNEYRGVHANAVKKYGSIENLKNQAIADMPQNAQYGVKTDAIRDYQEFIAYERSLADAKYIENRILPSSTREGKVKLPKQVQLAEAPTIGEAPIQQVSPKKFAIEADTDIVQPAQAIEQPNVGTIEQPVPEMVQPQVNAPEMVQPEIPVPQGQVKTRGGIKTIEKGFGEDVANQVTDRTYETRGLARNEAEYANLTPEQQADLVNTDDISDLAIRAKQKNLENQMNLGAVSGRDLNKYAKQGTEQAQAFQARDNINTPVGALTATQSVIRKATPKRINDIIDNADNIVNAVTTARTSVAKVDNLNNALKGTVKRERKYLVDRILKLEADGQLNADNVIKLVNKKYNIPEITQNDLTKIQELTTNISNATTERDVQVAKGLLRKFMVDKVPKTMRNKVNTYRYINMLLSPKSRSKDFIFTAAFQGEQAIDEAFAQLPALASRIFKGINTRSGLQPKAWLGGLKKGFAEGVQDVKLGIETGRAGEGTRFDLPRGQQFAYTPLKDIGVEPNVIKKIAMVGENVLSKLEKALNYTIRVPDRMFYEAKYASSIADQLKAANVKEPTSEMIEQAVKEAKDAVYQGDTWASKVSLGSRDLLNKIPTGPIKVGDLTMPFVQTVANISEEGLKNVGGLPVGMTKWGVAKTPAELRDAELLIGKGLKSLGYLGVGGGIAAGAIKSNIGDLSLTGKDKDAVTGMQPQSIAIGDKSFSIANAPNVTIPIAIYKSLLDQGTPQDRALRAGMAAATAVGDMPAFKTLGDLVKSGGEILSNAFDDDTQGAIDAAKQMGNQQIANVTGQFIPLTGAMGNIRNIVDPYSREQYTQDLGQYITNKTINRIPFASQSLPMRYGITGEPVMMTNIKNPIARAAGELVDPFSVRNYTPNPTIDTMKSLTKQAEGIKGNKAFNIKKAKRSIDINGVRTKLSPKEYSQYQKDYGKINYYLRQKALKSKTWKMANSEEKIKYMRDLNSSIDQAVKSVLFNHSPKRQEKYTQEIIDNYDTFTK